MFCDHRELHVRTHSFATRGSSDLHFAAMMQMAGGLDLDDPSLPPVTDIPSLQAAIRAFIDARAIPAGGWVVVWQYDNEALPEKRHITRAELDAVAADRKIVEIGRAHV